MTVEVQDFRVDTAESDTLQASILETLTKALSPADPARAGAYRLQLGILDHRSVFRGAHWDGHSRLRATLFDARGRILDSWVVDGMGRRSSFGGYGSARRSAGDALKAALVDLIARLNTAPLEQWAGPEARPPGVDAPSARP